MEIVLSRRLQAIADMVTPGSRVADVGCDHGFLSIYLVQKKISPRVLAMDVRKGPLSRAKEHIAECGLNQYIETRLSDGLEAYRQGEADTMVCAGMGGRLMEKIITRGGQKAKTLRELILQPQSELPAFRRFLGEQGYCIVKENILCEEGKFYFLIKAVWTGQADMEQEPLYEEFGKQLLEHRHPVLKEYLAYRINTAEGIEKRLACEHTPRAEERKCQVREELAMLRQAEGYFEQEKEELR